MAGPPRPGPRRGAPRPPKAAGPARPGPQKKNQTDLIALPKKAQRKVKERDEKVDEPPKPEKAAPSMASRSIRQTAETPALRPRDEETTSGRHTFQVDRAPVGRASGGGVGGGALAVVAIVLMLLMLGVASIAAVIGVFVFAPELILPQEDPIVTGPGDEDPENTLIDDGGVAGNPEIADQRVRAQPRRTVTASPTPQPTGPVLANATVKMSPASTFRVNQVFIECQTAGVSLKQKMGSSKSVTISGVPTGERCSLSLAGPLGRVRGDIRGGQTVTCNPQGSLANCR